MRILVTGAAGFVGANVARHLARRGGDVHGAVRGGAEPWRLHGTPVETHEHDLGDPGAVASVVTRVRPDVIIHAAAHGGSSWHTSLSEMARVNIIGTDALIEAAVATDVHYVIALGSSSEYGISAVATSELDRLRPNSAYATTKAAATHLVGHAIRSGRLRGVVLRLYSVYGPYEDARRLMPTVAWWAAHGAIPPTLASPSTARDFVHVADVCRAIDLCIDTVAVPDEPPILNIGSGRQTTLAEVTDVVRREFGIADEPSWGTMSDRSWDTATWVADIRRAQSQLGWTPAIELADGLRDLAAFVVDHADRYRPAETETI